MDHAKKLECAKKMEVENVCVLFVTNGETEAKAGRRLNGHYFDDDDT